jgi:retinoid hydroxylase
MNTEPKPANAIPGGFRWPFFGEIWEIIRQKDNFFWNRYQQHGKIFKVRSMGQNFAIIVGLDANRFILKDGADRLSTRLGWKSLEPILTEDMLLLQDGEKHRTSRRLILPVFHDRAITSYFAMTASIVTETIVGWGDRGTIDLNTELRKLTLNVAIRIFLGCEKTEELDTICDLFIAMMNYANKTMFAIDLPFTSYGKMLNSRRKIVEYVRKIVRQRMNSPEASDKQDALGLLLGTVDENGNKFTENKVINQAIGFLFAAHETTSNLMTFLLFELGNRPEWRERLRDEYDRTIGREPVEMSHLRQLPQTANVLKEGERLYPPAPFLQRGVVEDIEFGGYVIPAGWTVLASPLFTHRLPEIYRDSDRFDPDRFASPREEDKRDPFALIGFGAGAHSCIGVELARMEMKLILIALLTRYNWETTPTIDNITYPLRDIFTGQPKFSAKLVPIATTDFC